MNSADTALVAAAFVYPVKACGALAVDELVFDRHGGIEGDRRWAVVDVRGQITWQGAHPRLALVRPRPQGDTLVLQAEGRAPLAVRDQGLAPCRLLRWSASRRLLVRQRGRDAGDEAARWLSELAGDSLRLVRLDDEAVAADEGGRVHLIALESAREVNDFLHARGELPADVLRYRPNLVFAGADAPLVPFVEDVLDALAWTEGGRIAITGRCVRCAVTDVDPATGLAGTQVLPALAALSAQRSPGGPVVLGAYGQATPGARLARGQAVALSLSL